MNLALVSTPQKSPQPSCFCTVTGSSTGKSPKLFYEISQITLSKKYLIDSLCYFIFCLILEVNPDRKVIIIWRTTVRFIREFCKSLSYQEHTRRCMTCFTLLLLYGVILKFCFLCFFTLPAHFSQQDQLLWKPDGANSLALSFSFSGIWSWITSCWMQRDTVSWQTLACAKRASWTESPPPPSVARPTTSPLRWAELLYCLPLFFCWLDMQCN